MNDSGKQLAKLLGVASSWDADLEIRKIDKGLELDFTAMYEAPTLSLDLMNQLGEFFGTDKIDVDDYGDGGSGCESCDYGSCYGHTIQIINPTKNLDVDLTEEKS